MQARRNFGLRPDLITQPLVSVGGNSAVPSTVDVYVNNLKTYSGAVGAGGYQIDNIPITNGAGEARVVLRDAAGHEQQTTVPFYASSSLLRPGLTDISVEAGVPRHGFGTEDDTYLTDIPVASASLRRGLTDWLTVEAHAEAGDGLANGGVGLVARTGSLGVASLALSGSSLDGEAGLQAYASYETTLGDLDLRASTQFTVGRYGDLATLAGERALDRSTDIAWLLDDDDFRPLKRISQLSASMPLSFDDGTLGGSLIDLERADGERSTIVTSSYSRSLPHGANFDATVFASFGDERTLGIFGGVVFPFGTSEATASFGVSSGDDGTVAVASVAKSLGAEPGNIGWRVAAGKGREESQSAALSYRSAYGWAQVEGARYGDSVSGTAQIDGAIATLGSGAFLASRIDDAFAVVETGMPGVRVLYENRPIGTTDAKGRLLVPDVRSYERNKFSIETLDLPVNVDVPATVKEVTPADRSGVTVDLRVRSDTRSAVIVLIGSDGRPVPAGSYGQLDGGAEFVVGYDGRAYVQNLRATNKAVITSEKGSCTAIFGFRPRGDRQVVIPVTCKA